ncbi:MAG: hypothetical protein GYA21_16055 [Myxococcales bacterium]|nr:hypothetical protein [Myxococcales bacterium]
MTWSCFLLSFLAVLPGPGPAPSTPAPLDVFEKLPEKLEGYRRVPASERFDHETLYQHIDGHAELYLSFGFRELLVLRYDRDGEAPIEVEIYDMGRSQDAFGVFAHGMERAEREVGQDSQYLSGMLTFWKDRFVVTVTAYPETEPRRRAVYALARTIAGLIKKDGALPGVVRRLPREGLAAESVRYFRHPVWLNSAYQISDGNPLALGPDTDAALARYKTGDNRHLLVLVEYPDERRAAAAEQSARKEILGDQPGPVRRPDGRYAALCRKKNRLALVFYAPDEKTARAALERAAEREAR